MLFLPYRASEIAVLRDVVSTWMRLAIFEAMNAEEGDPHLWFVVDELNEHVFEDAVMASEIERLPDLAGFLKLASQPEWQRVTLSRTRPT